MSKKPKTTHSASTDASCMTRSATCRPPEHRTKYRYDPFGNTISKSGSLADANVYRFSSKEIHPASGMYYYGYRFYEPSLQRWITRDPLGESGFELLHGSIAPADIGQANVYLFIGNAPTHRWDPNGLQNCPVGPCFLAPCPPFVGLGYCAILCAQRGQGVPIAQPTCLFCFPPSGPPTYWITCPCSGIFKKPRPKG